MKIFLVISYFYILCRHFLLTIDSPTSSFKNDCQENDYKLLSYVKYSNHSQYKLNRTVFANFDKFSDLYTLSNNSDINCNFTFTKITNFLTFIPKRSLIVDEKFWLQNILTQSQINNISYLQFINIKGIDVALRQIYFTRLKRIKKYIQMEIYSSHFDVFSKGVNAECAINVYLNQSTSNTTHNMKLNFLNSFNSVKFVNTAYPKRWCTLAFANSKLDNLIFADVTNSYLKQNRLNF